MGKTTLIKRKVLEYHNQGIDFFIHDSRLQCEDFIGVHIYDYASLDEYLRKVTQIQIVFHDPDEKAFAKMVELINKMEDTIIVLDDIAFYIDVFSKELDTFIRASGQKNQTFIFSTHRPQDVPRLATSQLDELYLFQTHEPGDLKYFTGHFTPEDIERLKTLTVGEYISKIY